MCKVSLLSAANTRKITAAVSAASRGRVHGWYGPRREAALTKVALRGVGRLWRAAPRLVLGADAPTDGARRVLARRLVELRRHRRIEPAKPAIAIGAKGGGHWGRGRGCDIQKFGRRARDQRAPLARELRALHRLVDGVGNLERLLVLRRLRVEDEHQKREIKAFALWEQRYRPEGMGLTWGWGADQLPSRLVVRVVEPAVPLRAHH